MPLTLYEGVRYPLRQSLIDGHTEVWHRLSQSGPNWTGQERMDIIKEARQSLQCSFCRQCLEALSPHAVQGEHEAVTQLPSAAVDVIHRIRTDPARMTKSVFDRAMSNGLSPASYIELIGVVAISVIVDTLHLALGLAVPPTIQGSEEPAESREEADVIESGAWVPISVATGEVNEIGVPRTANIVRSMGLVPEIVTLFFLVMRQGYYINQLPLALDRSQTELIAARVSALNQCFY